VAVPGSTLVGWSRAALPRTRSRAGCYACRFRCPEDPAEPVRRGFMLLDDLKEGDEDALAESDPATEIG
jgi:hypothetical protein